MRHSDFWELMDAEFGAGYAASIAQDHCLASLGGRTSTEALAAGSTPREVWLALCDAFDVPPSRRFGRDKPPARR
ncbi:MAG: DUF3046 domain-containing protein [Dermatophilaceae bacterium]|jgi:hypothetical protein|nr:DUF3046 domain-containing protein [Dermatophilaceae bacterium]HRB99392.1 DUF3046 domain-containing protein [Dermatophilaceae bacterium]